MAALASWRLRAEPITFPQLMTSQELGHGHAALAGWLEFKDLDNALLAGTHFASCNKKLARKLREDLAEGCVRTGLARPGFGAVDDYSQWGLAFSVQERICCRPRLHGANLIAHLRGGAAPID